LYEHAVRRGHSAMAELLGFEGVQDNAYVLVLISGPRAMDTSELGKETLDKVQKKVEDAFKLPK
jgi:hypothetical protein